MHKEDSELLFILYILRILVNFLLLVLLAYSTIATPSTHPKIYIPLHNFILTECLIFINNPVNIMAYHNYPVLHPWHSLDIGKKPPEFLNGIVEIGAGSRVKYEIDKKSGLIYVDRILFGPNFYPQNYGFIPQSYCEDGDPLDVIIFSQESLVPRSIAPCRVIGAIVMLDGDEMDDKIISVLEADPAYKNVQTIDDLPPAKLEELKEFFTIYKRLEKKPVTVKEIVNKEAALKVVENALLMYDQQREKLQLKE